MTQTNYKERCSAIALFLRILWFMLLVTALAEAHQADEASAVRAALTKNALGFERKDLKMISAVWADDADVTVFESGHANYGWADYRDHHLVPEMMEMSNTKYALSDIKVHTTDDRTAWATFKYAISADVEGRHVEGTGLGTVVLEKRDGSWRIVHWHSSAPRRPPANVPKKKK